MTTPTFAKAKKSDTAALTRFFKSVQGKPKHRWQGPGIAISAFLDHPEPAILARLSGHDLFLLVLHNGACAAIESNRLESETYHETLRTLIHPDPIGAIRQATAEGRRGVGVFDQSRGETTTNYAVATQGMETPGPFQTLMLTQGARAMPFAPSPQSPHTCADPLMSALRAWSNSLNNPFALDLDGTKGWDAEEETSFTGVVLDAMLALGASGSIDIRAADEDSPFAVLHEKTGNRLEQDMGQRALWLAKRCLDTSRFVGYTWEYNDGSRTRQSGYSAYSVSIVSIDLDAISHHERLAAHRRTQDRLAGLTDPKDADAITAFFDTAVPFWHA